MPSEIKGTGLKILLDWLKASQPPARVEAILVRLAPASRATITGRVLSSFQYPYALYGELLEAIEAELGTSYSAQAFAHGRYAADVLLETVYRLTVKPGNVPRTIEVLADAWKVYFDTGEIRVHDLRAGHCVLAIEDASYHPLHPPVSAGYVQRACERAGASRVKVDVTGQPPLVELTIGWT